MPSKLVLALAALILVSPCMTSISPLHGYDAQVREYFKKDEIIINYKPGTKFEEITRIAGIVNSEVVYRSHFANFVTIRFDSGKHELWSIIEKLESFSEVVFAEPNGIAYVFWTPNDPYFQYQWNFGSEHIAMELAWDIERGGSSSVIVGILDTGVAYETYQIPSHEVDSVESDDGYYHRSPDLASTNFATGYDAINLDGHPNDMHGHGTHCAGTVAQSTNNAKGVAGMAFNSTIMPVRVLNAYGSGSCDQISDGIYYAYQNGADVLSMSLGGAPGDSTGFGTVHQAIIAARNAGSVIVAATGNSGDGELSYPAGFPECIAVGATDIDKNLAPYSQWGTGIDVVAPGGDLYDTIPGTTYAAGVLQSTYWYMNDGYGQLASVDSFGYTFLQGTSMATPHVAGLAALLIAHGITGPSQIEQAIYSTCTDLGSSGYDLYFGHGLINPPVALGAEVLFSSMPIIQNPYAQQYIDIWVVPRKPIYNDLPDTCLISLGGSESSLNFEKVAAQTYRTDFYFEESGTATIYVTARDDTTMTKGSITRQFSVTAVYGMDGGIAESVDELFSLSIPSHEHALPCWIVISDEKLGQDDDAYFALSRAYRCGPEGNEIATPSVVRIAFDRDVLDEYKLEDIGIYQVVGEALEYRQTGIDAEQGYAYATVGEFGTYVLVCWQGRGTSREIDVQRLALSCYPNPARGLFVFNYSIPWEGSVDIALYDAAGRRIKTLESHTQKIRGLHADVCDLKAEHLSCGVYFLRVEAKSGTITIEESKKIIVVR